MQRITAGEIEAIFEHWKEVMESPRSRLDVKRREAIHARLRDGYSLVDLCDAVNGCRASRFHMGENDRHKSYNDIGLICRDAEHLDGFIDTWETTLKQAEGAEQREAEEKGIQLTPEERKERSAKVLQILRSARK